MKFDVRLLLVQVEKQTQQVQQQASGSSNSSSLSTNNDQNPIVHHTITTTTASIIADEWNGQLATVSIHSVLSGLDLVQMSRDRARTTISNCVAESVAVKQCSEAARFALMNLSSVSSSSSSSSSSTFNLPPSNRYGTFTADVFSSPSVCIKCTLSVESIVTEWRHDSKLETGADSWAFDCVDPVTSSSTSPSPSMNSIITIRAPSDEQLLAAAGSIALSQVTTTATTTAAVLGAPAVVAALAASLTLGRCKESPSTLYRLWRETAWMLGPFRHMFEKHNYKNGKGSADSFNENFAASSSTDDEEMRMNFDPMTEAAAAVSTFLIAFIVFAVHVAVCAIGAQWRVYQLEKFIDKQQDGENSKNKEIKKYEYVVHRGEDEETRKEREEQERKRKAEAEKRWDDKRNKPFKERKEHFKDMAIVMKFPSITIRILMMLHPLAAITSFYTVAHVKSQLLLNPPLFVAAACVGGLCVLFPFALFRFIQKTASSQFQADEAFQPTLTVRNSDKTKNKNNDDENEQDGNGVPHTDNDEKDELVGGVFFMQVPEHLYFYKSERDLNKISACCCFHDEHDEEQKITDVGELDRSFLDQQQRRPSSGDVDDFERMWKSFSFKIRRAVRRLLPVGRFGPSSRFRRFGAPVSRLLPTWTVSYGPWEPVFVNALAFLLAVPLRSWAGCVVQYLLIALLACWNVIVTHKIQPFRTRLFWLTHAATWLSLAVICVAATLVRTAPWIVHVLMLPAFTVLFGVAILDLASTFFIFILEWKEIDGKNEELWTWSSAVVEEMEDEDEDARRSSGGFYHKNRTEIENHDQVHKKKKNNLSSLFQEQEEEVDEEIPLQHQLETSASITRLRSSSFSPSASAENHNRKKDRVSFSKTGGGALSLSDLQRCLVLPDEILDDAPIQQLGKLVNQQQQKYKNSSSQQQQRKRNRANTLIVATPSSSSSSFAASPKTPRRKASSSVFKKNNNININNNNNNHSNESFSSSPLSRKSSTATLPPIKSLNNDSGLDSTLLSTASATTGATLAEREQL